MSFLSDREAPLRLTGTAALRGISRQGRESHWRNARRHGLRIWDLLPPVAPARSAPEPIQEPGCPFCSEKVRYRAEAVNDSVFAVRDAYPVTPGHMLVIPYRHTADFFTMTPDERADAQSLIQQLKLEIQDLDPEVRGFNIGSNCGRAAGQTVMHAHIHLIPRREGDTPDPRGGIRGAVPPRMSY